MNDAVRKSVANYVSPTVIWLLMALAFAAFVVISIALVFHWKNYNADENVSNKIIRTYFIVSAIFLIGMIVSALMYSS